MKKLIILAAALLLCGSTAAMAAPNRNEGRERSMTRPAMTAVSPAVTQAFASHPNGGPELTSALAGLIASDCSLAADVAAAARNSNLDQKIAAGKALAQAEAAAGDEGGCKEKIKKAAAGADQQTVAAYQAALGDVVAEEGEGGRGGRGGRGGEGRGGGGYGGGGGGGGGSVSPHR